MWPQIVESIPQIASGQLSIESQILLSLPPVMLEIARAESNLDPTAKNASSTASGLFQILNGTWEAYGCVGDVFEATDNIDCARKIFYKEGTKPWEASRTIWEKRLPTEVRS